MQIAPYGTIQRVSTGRVHQIPPGSGGLPVEKAGPGRDTDRKIAVYPQQREWGMCMAEYDIIWEKALPELSKHMRDFEFQVWFSQMRPFLEEDDIYYFAVANKQHKRVMEQKHADLVQQALQKAYLDLYGRENNNIAVCFVSPEEQELYENSRQEKIPSSLPESEEHRAPERKAEFERLSPELNLDLYTDFINDDPEETDEVYVAFEEDPPSPYGEPYAAVSVPAPAPLPAAYPEPNALKEPPGINPEHTFDSFVVGESNMFASKAARAVANSPGLVYNPLFLYGGVGLGKTHLMHAIANAILQASPHSKIVYVSSEKFTNELINMIGRTSANIDMREQFRNKYRSVDVLMIDDIQFLAGKDKTQDEFFHTFNELQQANKQIIVSSDRAPHELEQLEERIVSRFEQGLIADIKIPDYETRVAILLKKAEKVVPAGLTVEDRVYEYIAEHRANIRTLEGALNRVMAFAELNRSKLQNGRIGPELAADALSDLFNSQKQKIVSPDQIVRTVCEFYNVDEEALRGTRRTKDVVFPRQVAMFLVREMTGLSYTKIAEFFQKKDHTTIMHAAQKIGDDMRANANIKKDVDDLMARMRNT